MKAEELRIGNLFKDESGKIYKTTWSTLRDIDNGMQCLPIQLNKEWLNDFGFKHEQRGNYSSSWSVYLMDGFNLHQSGGFANPQYWKVTTIFGCPPIYSVHQLQNIFYDLKREELMLKTQ